MTTSSSIPSMSANDNDAQQQQQQQQQQQHTVVVAESIATGSLTDDDHDLDDNDNASNSQQQQQQQDNDQLQTAVVVLKPFSLSKLAIRTGNHNPHHYNDNDPTTPTTVASDTLDVEELTTSKHHMAPNKQFDPRRHKPKAIFPLWTRMTTRLHNLINRAVVAMAVFAARRPIPVIAAVLVVSFTLIGVGFFTNFELNVNETELYAPFNSIPKQQQAWRTYESGFQEGSRVTTMVIHADGDNLLSRDAMAKVFEALDVVRATPGYDEICDGGAYYDTQTDTRTCRIVGATRYWYHDTNKFFAETSTDEDVQLMLSETEYPGGTPVDHDFVLGQYEKTDVGGIVTYVPAYFMYVLLTDKDDGSTKDFEKIIIRRLEELQEAWDNDPSQFYQLEFFAERSFSDEFKRAIENDMPLVPVIFFMMSGFTCLVFFSKDRVQSRCLLGVGSVTTIGMSLMTGYGLMFCIGKFRRCCTREVQCRWGIIVCL